jgi:hypothetical protein
MVRGGLLVRIAGDVMESFLSLKKVLIYGLCRNPTLSEGKQ